MDIQKLEFCEEPYTYSNYFPQVFSAIGHFPLVPIYLVVIEKHHNFFVYILLLLQFISMFGHLVTNPYFFYIPQLSSMFIIYWLFLFIFNTTTELNTGKSIVYLGLTVSSFLFCMWIVGLYYTIFLHVFMFLVLIRSTTICNLLSKRNRLCIFGLFFLSFMVLGLEVLFCNNLLEVNSSIPWHLCFDILFWQITCNCILFSYLNISDINIKKVL